MKKARYVLGINTTYHELAACLLKDGKLIAAVEEERFSRVKHGKKALIDNPDTIPYASIDYCLQQADITLRDVEIIGLSFCPEYRLKNINIDPFFQAGDWGSEDGEKLFHAKLLSIPKKLSEYARSNIEDRIKWIPHHLCHASSAYFVSPFKTSAILSIDGIGETQSTWFGSGKNNMISEIKSMEYPNSVGFLWEKMAKFLGFSEYDAQKVMGLASYGKWRKYYGKLKEIVELKPNGEYTTSSELLKFRLDDYSSLEQLFGIRHLSTPKDLNEDHADIAASLQKVTNELFIHFGNYLADVTNSKNICLAGGVALNCVANTELMKDCKFKDIYIQPAANDAGTALGAAYYIWCQMYGEKKSFVMDHAYWGSAYRDKEIEECLVKEDVVYQRIDKIEVKAASLVAEGNIVGWFQGRMEWGPRALGNRSLLADPRNAHMQEILNLRIKRREPFRPFAPSVLKDFVKDWFIVPTNCSSRSIDFMEFAFPVKAKKRNLIPAVVHVDGTSRIQSVDQKTNPRYYQLISEFYKLTKVPMVLNTSFNENEPIVCSPVDAIRTFKRTKMDYLVLNNFLIGR